MKYKIFYEEFDFDNEIGKFYMIELEAESESDAYDFYREEIENPLTHIIEIREVKDHS